MLRRRWLVDWHLWVGDGLCGDQLVVATGDHELREVAHDGHYLNM